MERKLSFHAFVGHDPTHGEHFPAAGAAAGNHDAREDLDPLFVAFEDLRMHVDRIADLEGGDLRLEARLFDQHSVFADSYFGPLCRLAALSKLVVDGEFLPTEFTHLLTIAARPLISPTNRPAAREYVPVAVARASGRCRGGCRSSTRLALSTHGIPAAVCIGETPTTARSPENESCRLLSSSPNTPGTNRTTASMTTIAATSPPPRI